MSEGDEQSKQVTVISSLPYNTTTNGSSNNNGSNSLPSLKSQQPQESPVPSHSHANVNSNVNSNPHSHHRHHHHYHKFVNHHHHTMPHHHHHHHHHHHSQPRVSPNTHPHHHHPAQLPLDQAQDGGTLPEPQASDTPRSDDKAGLKTMRTRKRKRTRNTRPHTPKLNTEPIKQLMAEMFPHRKFLGSIIYNPTTRWSTLQTETLYGLKPDLQRRFAELKTRYIERSKNMPVVELELETRYIPYLPPLSSEYVNSVVEIIIPFRHIVTFKQDLRNEIPQYRREVWGGASGVYTDDSDILYALMHLGFFDEEEEEAAEGEEGNGGKFDLSVWNPSWDPTVDLIKPIRSFQRASSCSSDDEEEEEQNNGAGGADEGVYGDLSVEILLLPPLPQYHGFCQHGINSRSWNVAPEKTTNQHSGLSFAVYNVKWTTRGSYLQNPLFHSLAATEAAEENHERDEPMVKTTRGWKFDLDTYKRIKKSSVDGNCK
ncbi:uncharacterized protein LODBEIA_P03570 [Lodderomyces beijingensis]|uniref:Rxt3-domain-containing protein n=1 Tax=Lodderomyces beijingensis TaxID=1775926 RepID=A0ABP0ZD78_9ASCO